MPNLTLYDSVRKVPQEAQKRITGGRLNGYTDINPMWRIKCLTEQFGPCGIGWWYKITDKRLEPSGNAGEIAAFVDIELYYKQDGEVSQPVIGTGGSSFVAKEKNGLYTSDECFKMALTDALSVACKALGMGADVYWDKDKTKYDTRTTAASFPDEKPELCEVCGAAITATSANTVQQIVIGTRKNTGKQMCAACYKAWRKEQSAEAAAMSASESARSEAANEDAGDRQ